MDDAKTRAAELPEELIGLVRQTTESLDQPERKHADSPGRDAEEEAHYAAAEHRA